MKALITGAALLLMVAPAAAQTSTSDPSSSNPQITQQNATSNQDNLAAAQKIKQDLQSAGFSDVKVVAESFVVQARTKDGNPVVMTIGPHGMSVFEAINSSNTTGSATSGSSSSPNGSSGAAARK